MKVLIAEDNPATRGSMAALVSSWGYEVVTASDGAQAWQMLQESNAPRLSIVDWVMPVLDGVELCRRVRRHPNLDTVYFILLTARVDRADIVTGLEGGADDYLTKPFDHEELRARIHVGRRILDLQQNLSERVRDLEKALSRVHQLHGLLPICAYCKKIRDDHNYWQQVEAYISAHSGVQFSHGICPECYEELLRKEPAAHPTPR
jgi:DNA-binding response OmpR family regulator